MIKMLQPAMGHEIGTNESEQGGEQMPIPACCDALKQENRSEVLPDVPTFVPTIPNNRIYLPRIFACTYFRPYMLLGACACEESVPTPLVL